MESEKAEKESLIKYIRYVKTMHDGYTNIREQMFHISERLKVATSHKDPRAHARAYRDLYGEIKKIIHKIPEAPLEFPFAEKTAEAKVAIKRVFGPNEPIPLINRHGTICMGCPWCPEWIDITKVFTDAMFSAQYTCANGHNVYFGGVIEDLPVTERKA